MNKLLLASVLLTSCVATASAELTLRVRCDQRCRVLLNGRYQGLAPVVFSNMAPGTYDLEVERVDTKEFKVFRVSSPAGEGLDRTYDISFYGPTRVSEEVMVRQTRTFETDAALAGRREPPPPVVVERPAPSYYYPPPAEVRYVPAPAPKVVYGPSQPKVRRRNAFLMLGVANEIGGHGQGKQDFRKGAIAATLLNELFTR